MKPKQVQKKLVVKKETIADLNDGSMAKVYGGCEETKTASCSYTILLSVCICEYTPECIPTEVPKLCP
jgi:hypothetical protein